MAMRRFFQHMQEKEKQYKKSKRKNTIIQHIYGYSMLAPAILVFSIFLIKPLMKTIQLSMSHTNAQGEIQGFAGLTYYEGLITNETIHQSVMATIYFVGITVPLTIGISLILAILANKKLKGSSFFKTIFASSMGISVAAASVIWLFMYNPSIGVFNRIISFFGGPQQQWLLDPTWALISVSLATVWTSIGFTFLILLSGLSNIDETLYEGAKIAGVSSWYQFRKITLPLLSPTLFFVVSVSLINAFQTFGQIDILTKGGPINATNVIVYAIYQDAFINHRVSQASALSILLFISILILTGLQFLIGERKVHYQ